MQEFLLIAVVLGVLWRWDEHTRRAERQRRQLENRQRQGGATAPYAGSLSTLTSPT